MLHTGPQCLYFHLSATLERKQPPHFYSSLKPGLLWIYLFSYFTLTTSCGEKRYEIKRAIRKQGLTSGWPFRRRNLLMWDKMLSERRWSHLFSARQVIQPARGISISCAVADRLVMASGIMLYMANMHVFICLLFTTIDYTMSLLEIIHGEWRAGGKLQTILTIN